MRVNVVSVALVLAAMLAVPASAFAQGDSRNSLSLGYSFMKLNSDNHNGFAVDFNRDVRTHGNTDLRAVVQFGQLHQRSRDVTMAAAGVQLAWTNVGRIVPFVEGAVGVFRRSQTTTRTNAVINYGAGADIKISAEDRWRIRAFVGWCSLLGNNGETGLRLVAAGQYRF